MAIHGTCSLCGGPVMTPDVWFGVFPPIPTCGSCGATKQLPHGPIVEMVKPPVFTNEMLAQKVRELAEKPKE